MKTDASAPAEGASLSRLFRTVTVFCFVLFVVWFLTRPMANLPRLDLWPEAPWLLLDSLLPALPEPGQPASSVTSGWKFLPQRFDLILTGLVVAVGSWHLGALLLRVIGRVSGSSFHQQSKPSLLWALNGLSGLSAWSLVVLGLGMAGLFSRPLFLILLAGFVVAEQWLKRRDPQRIPGLFSASFRKDLTGDSPRAALICTLVCVPFVMAMLLGSLLPSTDFDVKAYHLTGPKEWFQTGRISFLPHNVYTNFPFLTEMLSLSTMVIRQDWFRGAMAGQFVLALYAPLTAIVILHGARLIHPRAGWPAALIYLTTPWACRISIIAYVEGALAAYLAGSLVCFLKSLPTSSPSETDDRPSANAWTMLCGWMAGSAMSCKYPGVISALIPFGVVVTLVGWQTGAPARISLALRRAVMFSVAGLLAVGPWLLKNLLLTGNPVYPLLWKVFGGRGIDAALNDKFERGHALPKEIVTSPTKWVPDLWKELNNVAVGSDWQSPLMFGLLPAAIACLIMTRKQRTGLVRPCLLGLTLLYAVYLFGTWWGLTHRIDRFWVPMLPVVAMLSGVGLVWILGRDSQIEPTPSENQKPQITRWLVMTALSVAVMFNLVFICSPLIGFNGYLMDERAAMRIAETPSMTLLYSLPEDSLTLMVGEAQVFDARRPVLYHTVFNSNLFEDLCAEPVANGQPSKLKSPEAVLETFHQRGITHVMVNWREILRYRTTYGFSDFVTPEHIHQLVASGVMTAIPLPGQGGQSRLEGKSPSELDQLRTWGKSLLQSDAEGEWFPALELYQVTPAK